MLNKCRKKRYPKAGLGVSIHLWSKYGGLSKFILVDETFFGGCDEHATASIDHHATVVWYGGTSTIPPYHTIPLIRNGPQVVVSRSFVCLRPSITQVRPHPQTKKNFPTRTHTAHPSF